MSTLPLRVIALAEGSSNSIFNTAPERLFEVYRNNLQGLDEMIKKLWTIADSPKTDSKEKIKAIVLIGQYYRERLELVGDEQGLNQKVK